MLQQSGTSRAVQALRLAWYASWLAVGAPLLLEMVAGGLSPARLAPLAGWLLSGAAAEMLYRRALVGRRDGLGWLALESAGAITVGWGTGGHGLEVVLFVIAAAQAPSVLSWRAAVGWVVAQTLLGKLVVGGGRLSLVGLASAVAELGFQAAALGFVYFASLEAQARHELACVNEDLRAAQTRLAEHARTEERLRIARDLHDALGHHLTALALNLEAASHVVEGRAAAHVTTARSLTRTALAELRGVVGTIREPAVLDLGGALSEVVRSVATPRIHLSLPEGLKAIDAERARCILRCLQEIITNAQRHARAENLRIEVQAGSEGLRLEARDDGQGAADVTPGNGLAGMRERLEGAGGSLEIATAPGGGFEVRAFVPHGARA